MPAGAERHGRDQHRAVHFHDPADRRPWLFPADVYSGTRQYASDVLQKQRGVNTRFTEPAGEGATTARLIEVIEDDPPALVFVEPVSNPFLDIIDVPAVAAVARAQGARVAGHRAGYYHETR